MKNKYYRVLDHGFVGLVDYMGTDADIEQAARVSYQNGTRKISDTRALIRYLIRKQHSSPIEQASLKFHLRLPLFVTHQLLRHRTAKLNSESGRYSIIKDLFYTPNREQYTSQSEDNKQGRSNKQIEETNYQNIIKEMYVNRNNIYQSYQTQIDVGVARELARIDLPVSTYTSLFWKMDLRNLFHFLSLRCDNHAQYEMREYANVIAAFVKELFPISYEAWYDYSFKAVTLSRLDRELLVKLKGIQNWENNRNDPLVEQLAIEVGMVKTNNKIRELDEFYDKFAPVIDTNFKLDHNKEITDKILN